MLFPYPAVGDVAELQRRCKKYGIISANLHALRFTVDDAHLIAVGADGAVITFSVDRPTTGKFKEALVPVWRPDGGVTNARITRAERLGTFGNPHSRA